MTAESADPPVDRYTVHGPLRDGRASTTFLAVERDSERSVVLRTLESRRSVSRLVSRANSLAARLEQLDDPRIVTVSDVGVAPMGDAGERAYVVRDFVVGQTVGEAAAQPAFGFRALLEIALAVAQALVAAHRAGLSHGDLKPSNIVLTPENEVRLVDFGSVELAAPPRRLSRLVPPLRARRAREAATFDPGARYVAPELIRGSRPAPSADMYAAGRVFSDLVEAVPAAEAATGAAARFRTIVDDLQAPDPALRTPAAELVRRLQEVGGLFASERGTAEVGAPSPAAEAASTAARPGGRVVNVWFESDEPVPPLAAGVWYTLVLNIGSPRLGAVAGRFEEPDFGGRDELELLVSLYSDELELESHTFDLRLPRLGDSDEIAVRARARQAGRARLRIVISALPELAVLQTLELAVDVVLAEEQVT